MRSKPTAIGGCTHSTFTPIGILGIYRANVRFTMRPAGTQKTINATRRGCSSLSESASSSSQDPVPAHFGSARQGGPLQLLAAAGSRKQQHVVQVLVRIARLRLSTTTSCHHYHLPIHTKFNYLFAGWRDKYQSVCVLSEAYRLCRRPRT